MNLYRERMFVLGLAGVLGLAAARADEPRGLAQASSHGLRLEPTMLPAPLVDAGKVNTVIEASAVEPIGDGRRLLIAHDKTPALFIVDTATGRILGEPITSPRFPQLNGAGPKWEGMARDAEGAYYLIGAHNGKTDQERSTKSVLIRFRLKDSEPPSLDDASIVHWDVSHSLENVLKAEGLSADEVAKRKVEGLAVRERKNAGGAASRELLIGLRAPTDKVRVFAADISNAPSPDAELELKPAFSFTAEPREGQVSELTSLEYVPALAGCLVLTASEDEANAFHGNALWFVPDGETSHAQKISTFEVAMKAEGLAVLGVENDGRRTAVKLLITYDNDAHATKIPSRFQAATLVRDER
jgi:hypothetical protein